VADRSTDVLFLDRTDVSHLFDGSYEPFVTAVERALVAHTHGETMQPLKLYLTQPGAHSPYDRLIAMPAFIGGDQQAVGLKWIGSCERNRERRGLDRASALIVLNDPETYYPLAIIEGGLISGVRTAAVSILATKHLAQDGFRTIAIIGCGFIGRLHALGFAQTFDSIAGIYLYDTQTEAADDLANTLTAVGRRAIVCATPEEAVQSADVVAACTVALQPTIQYEWLKEGCLICNISLADVGADAYLAIDKLVVDDWEQANVPGKILNTLVAAGQVKRSDLFAELGDIVAGRSRGRESAAECILLNPMGLAVEDVACATYIYENAINTGVGTWLPLV
jgi:N-[(2S)-2-amino-2-carboxyethyl]-L-glutamate dehydrogenase